MKLVLLLMSLLATAASAQELRSTEFTVTDALTILGAEGWSFVYEARVPVRQIDVVIYEEHTDKQGRTTTTVRRGAGYSLGRPAIKFEIKMLLDGQTLHSRIDSAGRSTTLGEEFAHGTHETRITGNRKRDADGKEFLIEIGNIDRGAMLPPNKTVLTFKVFEDLDPVLLDRILEGPGKG